uniref:Uncharacterized protein n=1 Tax=Zooxanthella nutricula TaxID=1333877 RepID=A0A7S2KA11_9DINO|mmetsp:Transcript_44809/g.135902  ORF Transcript_44809/g.135902 Transcript_44809/m.135902 type:complete len:181 (+) Transcript_44809:2-544(+)
MGIGAVAALEAARLHIEQAMEKYAAPAHHALLAKAATDASYIYEALHAHADVEAARRVLGSPNSTAELLLRASESLDAFAGPMLRRVAHPVNIGILKRVADLRADQFDWDGNSVGAMHLRTAQGLEGQLDSWAKFMGCFDGALSLAYMREKNLGQLFYDTWSKIFRSMFSWSFWWKPSFG